MASNIIETRKILAQLVGLGALVLVTGSAAAPDTSRYVPPPQGSTWNYRIANTGSYGSGDQQTTRTMKTASWQGRQMLLVDDSVLPRLHLDDRGCSHGQSRGANPFLAFDPPVCGAKRPFVVGETTSYKVSGFNLAGNSPFSGEGKSTVEAFEEVVVPAGKFMAFRLRYVDTHGNENVTWWSQELGINVKWSNRRSTGHWLGSGTQEVQLVSHTIRR